MKLKEDSERKKLNLSKLRMQEKSEKDMNKRREKTREMQLKEESKMKRNNK
jgi:hypothetical protein